MARRYYYSDRIGDSFMRDFSCSAKIARNYMARSREKHYEQFLNNLDRRISASPDKARNDVLTEIISEKPKMVRFYLIAVLVITLGSFLVMGISELFNGGQGMRGGPLKDILVVLGFAVFGTFGFLVYKGNRIRENAKFAQQILDDEARAERDQRLGL